MNKSILRISVLTLIIVLALFTFGCAKEKTPEMPTYTDGIYFAQEESFSGNGWKYMVTLTVEDGKIVKADWNGANVNGGEAKKTVSKTGKYNMVAFGGAQSEWHEQALLAENHLISTQNPTAISYTDDEGHTDEIAGASIHVIEFFSLAENAIAAGPVGRGPYNDGHYHAEEAVFAGNGWRTAVDLTVVNGTIVSVNWNGGNRDGGTNKKTRSISGNYNMVAYGNAQAEWHEQAFLAEAHLLESQDPGDISYTDDKGHTDAIAGVSVHVIEFFALAEEALAAGPVTPGPYRDGTYHAEAAEFASSGWKSTVDLTVLNGNIFAANWNAVNAEGADKKTASIEGEYGMVAKGNSLAEWHVEAMAVEDYLLNSQDPTKISYSDDEGHTDEISGVTIHVSDFFNLAQEALAAGPVKQE